MEKKAFLDKMINSLTTVTKYVGIVTAVFSTISFLINELKKLKETIKTD